MARQTRINVAGGTYLVTHGTPDRHPMLLDDTDRTSFETLLGKAIGAYGCTLHAFCWLPHRIQFLVTVGELPVSRLMQKVMCRYAPGFRRRHDIPPTQCWGRYHAALIDPATCLLKAVAYLHWLPVIEGLAQSPESYPWSSHRHYTGQSPPSWLTRLTVLESFSRRWSKALTLYNRFMRRRPAAEAIQRFTDKAGVIGPPTFVCHLPRDLRIRRGNTSLEQIISSVCLRFGVDRAEITGPSRVRGQALIRSVIAWHAIERRAATLTQASRRLNRRPPTLLVAMRRHRSLRPELFDVRSMPDYARPLLDLPLDDAGSVRPVACTNAVTVRRHSD